MTLTTGTLLGHRTACGGRRTAPAQRQRQPRTCIAPTVVATAPNVDFGMFMLACLVLYGLFRGVVALVKKARLMMNSMFITSALPPANVPSWHPEHLN